MVDCELPLAEQLLLLESSADHINKSLSPIIVPSSMVAQLLVLFMHCFRSNRPSYGVLGRELLSWV